MNRSIDDPLSLPHTHTPTQKHTHTHGSLQGTALLKRSRSHRTHAYSRQLFEKVGHCNPLQHNALFKCSLTHHTGTHTRLDTARYCNTLHSLEVPSLAPHTYTHTAAVEHGGILQHTALFKSALSHTTHTHTQQLLDMAGQKSSLSHITHIHTHGSCWTRRGRSGSRPSRRRIIAMPWASSSSTTSPTSSLSGDTLQHAATRCNVSIRHHERAVFRVIFVEFFYFSSFCSAFFFFGAMPCVFFLAIRHHQQVVFQECVRSVCVCVDQQFLRSYLSGMLLKLPRPERFLSHADT